jgi:hypothetical protein
MATEEDLNTSAIALVGFLGAILVFAVIVILMIVFYQVEARQQYEKDVSQAYGQVSQLAADQQGRLASYGWVDQEKKIARIPVKRAMGLVVAELSQNPSGDVTGANSETVPPDDGREDDDDQ